MKQTYMGCSPQSLERYWMSERLEMKSQEAPWSRNQLDSLQAVNFAPY